MLGRWKRALRLPACVCAGAVLAASGALAQPATPLGDAELQEALTGKTLAFTNRQGKPTVLRFEPDARLVAGFPDGVVRGGAWKVEGGRLCMVGDPAGCRDIRRTPTGALQISRQDGSFVPFEEKQGFAVTGAPERGLALTTESSGPATVREGDTWTFDAIQENGSRKQSTETVLAVLSDGTVSVSNGSLAWRMSPVFNAYDTRGVEVPQVRLPLAVGNQWEATEYWVSMPYHGENRLQFKVVAREQVQVPAGSMDAFRITAEGWQVLRSHPTGSQGRIEQTYWYAPALKRIVKFTGFVRWSTTSNRGETWTGNYELRSAKVAP